MSEVTSGWLLTRRWTTCWTPFARVPFDFLQRDKPCCFADFEAKNATLQEKLPNSRVANAEPGSRLLRGEKVGTFNLKHSAHALIISLA